MRLRTQLIGLASRNSALFAGTIPAGDEHVAVGEFFEQLRRLVEIGGEHVDRICRDPLRQVDGFIDAGVESDQDACGLVADVLDRVAVPLRDVADISLL